MKSPPRHLSEPLSSGHPLSGWVSSFFALFLSRPDTYLTPTRLLILFQPHRILSYLTSTIYNPNSFPSLPSPTPHPHLLLQFSKTPFLIITSIPPLSIPSLAHAPSLFSPSSSETSSLLTPHPSLTISPPQLI